MKRKVLIFSAVLVVLVMSVLLVGCGDTGSGTEKNGDGYYQMTMAEASEKMAEMDKTGKDYILVDVRREDEYATGHIRGAVLIPNETIEAGADSAVISELPDKEQMILVYCRSGNRSKEASKKLASQGYENVYEIGGIIDWQGKLIIEED